LLDYFANRTVCKAEIFADELEQPSLELKSVLLCCDKMLFSSALLPNSSQLRIEYNWALIVGLQAITVKSPKVCYLVRERLVAMGYPLSLLMNWQLEVVSITMRQTSMLLVGVVIGRVTNAAQLQTIFRGTPMAA
jgi:hypothetical protein